VTTGKYLCAESGGGTILVANRTVASGWETFRVSELFKDCYIHSLTNFVKTLFEVAF